MTDPVDRLSEIRERRDAATSGPWFARENDLIGGWCVTEVDELPSSGAIEVADFASEFNARFVAASWADVGWLLEHIEELRARQPLDQGVNPRQPIGVLQRLVDECHEYHGDLVATVEREQDLRLAAVTETAELRRGLERLQAESAGNAALSRYWNRRYVETARQHADEIRELRTLRKQRQAALDLCNPELQRASSYSSFAKRVLTALGGS